MAARYVKALVLRETSSYRTTLKAFLWCRELSLSIGTVRVHGSSRSLEYRSHEV
jgi:hypothetical protein